MDIQLWREILDPYFLAVDELKVKFQHLKSEYNNAGEYCPIDQIEGRVKSIASIIEKAQKKDIPLDEIEDRLVDIAGIRIICQFVEDIQTVVNIIKNRVDMNVILEKDYITNSKPSGYRSYHLIIEYLVHTTKGAKKLKAEIQIRTLAMDFWATIEHSLQYKYKYNIPQTIKTRLSNAANAIIVLDNEMAAVRDEIMDAQDSLQLKDNIVSDILTNVQNLYKVANKREIIKIQDEFLKIYKDGDLYELEKFRKELDIISESYRAQSLM